MLEDAGRTPRRKHEASDLHRWAMLRMAINEDKCHTLAKKDKTKTEKKTTKTDKKNKKSKESKESKESKKSNESNESNEPPKMSSLFQDLPSLAAMKTWKSKAHGDIRQKYGGKTEWDNGLTDSAYLMYGIPRATLKQEHLVKLKERQLRKKVTPRSINYSQSFSHYSTPMPEDPYTARNRHSMAGNSIESSLSTLSSSPSSPDLVRVTKLPPNSVSVLPLTDPKLVNLYHVKPKNGEEALNGARSGSGLTNKSNAVPTQNHIKTSTGKVVANGVNGPIRNTVVIGSNNNSNNSDSNNPIRNTVVIGSNNNNNNNNNNNSNNNCGALGRKTAREGPGFTHQNVNASTQTLPRAGRTIVNPVSPTQVNFNRPISNNVLVDVEVQTDRRSPAPAPVNLIPPAPKMPIHKRPPHPAPKPKSHAARIHKINLAPLHEALMGSLNKRLQRQLLKTNFIDPF